MSPVTFLPGAIVSTSDSAVRPTAHKIHDYHCEWSPEGKHNAFASERVGAAELLITPAEGGEATPVNPTDNLKHD